MSLLDQLVDAMDAADEYNAGRRARVEIVLRRGAMVARAVAVDGNERTEILRRPTERMIGVDQLDLATWTGVARAIVDDAVNAL